MVEETPTPKKPRKRRASRKKKATINEQIALTSAIPVTNPPQPSKVPTVIKAGAIGAVMTGALLVGVHKLPDALPVVQDYATGVATEFSKASEELSKVDLKPAPPKAELVAEKKAEAEVGDNTVTIKGEKWSQLRIGGSASWRYNNPGLIYYGDFAKSVGAIGTDGRYAIFDSYESGRKALQTLLFTSGQGYKDKTLEAALTLYAPENEGFNTKYYLKVVKADTGIPMTKIMKDFSEKEQTTLLDTLEKIERFTEGKVSEKGNGVAE